MARRCGTSQSHVGRRRKALGSRRSVGQANRQRAPLGASEGLDDPSSAAAALPLRRVDVPLDPRLPTYPPLGPTHRLPDLYCVMGNETWYYSGACPGSCLWPRFANALLAYWYLVPYAKPDRL